MKNNKGSSYFILIIGALAIIVITICTFWKDDIIYYRHKHNIINKYSNLEENEYYLEDNFEYVDNYTDLGLKSKEDVLNFIYYAINSGNNSFKRYIDKDYTNYESDIDKLVANKGEELVKYVSNFNNFVHPYNSTAIENSINLTYGDKYELEVKINRIYTDEEINEINEVVDSIIKDNITNDMPTKEKIKIIHDYIINHAQYDQNIVDKASTSPYKSNTAYGVLIEGYGTCNGYADAMAIFLNKLNVINYKISSDTHVWNLVYLDGKWYHLDLTWDDPISDINITRDTYFLITTEELKTIDDELLKTIDDKEISEANANSHKFDKNIYSEAA